MGKISTNRVTLKKKSQNNTTTAILVAPGYLLLISLSKLPKKIHRLDRKIGGVKFDKDRLGPFLGPNIGRTLGGELRFQMIGCVPRMWQSVTSFFETKNHNIGLV